MVLNYSFKAEAKAKEVELAAFPSVILKHCSIVLLFYC
jgi:hypothetical protein